MSEDQNGGKPRRTWTAAQRASYAKRAQAKQAPGRPASDSELVAEAVVGEAVDNVKGLSGMFVTPLAPHTGFTITGVPVPDYEPGEQDWQQAPQPGQWLVRSRADAIGRALLPQAQRNRRLLAILARFNDLLRNVEVLEAAGAVMASAVIDAGLAPPDAVVVLPGGIQYPVFGAVVQDTIDYVAGLEQQAGERPKPEREEKRARHEGAAAGAPPGPDGTTRDEGQQVVSGGVTET